MKKILLLALAALYTVNVWGQLNTPNGTIETTTNPTTGNVGIGTTSPTSNLHISALSNPQFQLRSESTGRRGLWLTVNDDHQTVSISSSCGTVGSYPMVFKLGLNERMRINENGNIGIGTTNPSSLLELNQTTPALTIHGNNINTEHGILRFRASRGTSYVYAGDILGKIEFQSQGSASTWSNCASIEVINSGSGGYWSPPADIIFKTSILNESLPTEKMRIAANGKVGIGVTNPTYKLTVNGTIGAREVNVTSEVWSDFVFEPDYNLMTLNDLDNFIKANKHLPEIPTTADVEKNGISVGEMNAKLLQKIEELTLYTIQQQKTIEGLLQRVEQLENK